MKEDITPTLGITGLLVKSLSKLDMEYGQKFFEPPREREDLHEVELSMVGIIDEFTGQGKTGVVFAFQHEGSKEMFLAAISEGLMDSLVNSYQKSKERFKEEKENLR